MDLIPFYARLVATLSPCLDDLAPTLVDLLLRDFRFQVRKKDQIHIHSKIKNCRFIGELGVDSVDSFLHPPSLPPYICTSLSLSLSRNDKVWPVLKGRDNEMYHSQSQILSNVEQHVYLCVCVCVCVCVFL